MLMLVTHAKSFEYSIHSMYFLIPFFVFSTLCILHKLGNFPILDFLGDFISDHLVTKENPDWSVGFHWDAAFYQDGFFIVL